MKRTSCLLMLLVFGLVGTNHGQLRDPRLSRQSMVERILGIPTTEANYPPNYPRRPVKHIQNFKVYATKPLRIADPKHPQLKPSQQEIMVQMYWAFDKDSRLLTLFGDPDGGIYQIIRDAKWGRDAYGFGEDYLEFIERSQYTVKRIGEINFNLPYVIKRRGMVIEVETFTEATWPEMLYAIASESMKCQFYPFLTSMPIQKVQISKYRVSQGLNYQPPKDFLWREANGKLFKRDMSDVKTMIKLQAEIEAKSLKSKASELSDKK